MSEILWQPTPEAIDGSLMRAFQRFVAERHGESGPASPVSKNPGDDDYDALYRWSVDRRGDFWRAVWDFCEVVGEPGERVMTDPDAMPGAGFFPDARLSFAENLVRRRDDAPAIVFRREDGARRVLSYAEVHDQVGRLQQAFRDAGVGPGDRVAAYLPNVPEAITAMLAATSLGAVWSSCSPDFGVPGVLDRFGQIEPTILLTADGYLYKGKRFDLRGGGGARGGGKGEDKLRAVVDGLPTVKTTVVLGYTTGEARDGSARPDLDGLRDAVAWSDWVPDDAPAPTFERFPFDQPLYILFSSGTTGKPKCIVHGAGGTLLQHLKEHRLHSDLRPGQVLFYFTTTGWMMWNWLVTGLASGATLVLYDGNPMHPGPAAMLDMAQDERIEIFGTSAKFIDAIKKAGLVPRDSHDLSALRTLCSTGSPLVPESFDYVYRDVKPDVQIASISGGTDIVSCFVLGCPIRPVRRGEIQCRGLGMAVEVWDPDGEAIIGEPGELVCTRPFPSMPVGFWNDPDGARYRAAYFDYYRDGAGSGDSTRPRIWRHGDWCTLTENDGLLIYGRSDATLNPGGVRIGTAEIYREVEQLDEIEEAIVVGQDWRGDQRIILFVRMASGLELDDALRQRIVARIRQNNTARHVPAKILAITDIPRTRSGKISEIAVRDVIHGRPVKNTEALANPEALEQFKGRPELAE